MPASRERVNLALNLIHSCGSVRALLDDFIAAGFDVLNPVQCSAARMNPTELKAEFGQRLTFWGGGVDTQRTTPFGSPRRYFLATQPSKSQTEPR
jgi:hypothetical protein